jgi:hypothetical protein
MAFDPKNRPGSADHDVFALNREVESLDDRIAALEAGGGGGGGAVSLVESITVGATTQDVTFSGLDGDADGFYMLTASVVHGTTPNPVEFSLEPNSVAPTARSIGRVTDMNGVTTSFEAAGTAYCGACTLARITWRTFLHAESGRDRVWYSDVVLYDDPLGDIQFQVNQTNIWDDDSSNITSLRIHADNASGIGAGSKFDLWKMS